MDKFHRKLTTISVSHENYLILKRLGDTGDSFNDVLTRILHNNTQLKGDPKTDT
jgi:predicted CopG family antitoxin